MTRARAIGITALLIIWGELTPRPAQAQALGTFRWQLQPFCNVVTVSVIQNGAVYTLDGYDDQCGGASRAPLVGLATPNPDGSIGMGFHLVTTPSATPVSVQSTIGLATLSGTWRDNAGNSGTFAFGAATGGDTRPPAVAAVPLPSQFAFQNDGGFSARGTSDVGTLPLPSDHAGPRMMWFPAKSAFRAGWVDNDDDVNDIGDSSAAFATGPSSFAAGLNSWASGRFAVALGVSTRAVGLASTALGQGTSAVGEASFAAGLGTTAAGNRSTALGFTTIANANNSVAMGNHAGTAVGAIGSFVYGDASDPSGVNLVASLPNQFLVRASGGTVFYSNGDRTSGVRLGSGAGAWTNLSDAARKQTFRDLDGETVLGKLRAMPIREWSYISQGDGIRHVGPTAQDFRAAFGLGEDPLGISTIDADGISLRAVQALEARTEAQQITIDELKTQNALLRQRLEALELRASATPPAPR